MNKDQLEPKGYWEVTKMSNRTEKISGKDKGDRQKEITGAGRSPAPAEASTAPAKDIIYSFDCLFQKKKAT